MGDREWEPWQLQRSEADFGRAVDAVLERANQDRWKNLVSSGAIATAVTSLEERPVKEDLRWLWVSDEVDGVLSNFATVCLVLLPNKKVWVTGYVKRKGEKFLYTANGRCLKLNERSGPDAVREFGTAAFCAHAGSGVAERWAQAQINADSEEASEPEP